MLELTFDTARLGENQFRARVRNRSDSTVLALLDLRAVPGMWMIPNMQSQHRIELEGVRGREHRGVALIPTRLRGTTAAVASTYAYVNPVVAVFLGWALAGEAITPRIALASAIIVGAVALITSARIRQRRPPPVPEGTA